MTQFSRLVGFRASCNWEALNRGCLACHDYKAAVLRRFVQDTEHVSREPREGLASEQRSGFVYANWRGRQKEVVRKN